MKYRAPKMFFTTDQYNKQSITSFEREEKSNFWTYQSHNISQRPTKTETVKEVSFTWSQ